MKIVRLIEQKLNRFLWCGKEIKAKAKVSWVNVCFPNKEGGLGIKQLEVWNRAAMMSHIWSLFTQAGSLWVAWVETIWLKGRSFWYIPIPSSCSWSRRKLLKLRELAKQLISFNIGKVSRVFLWCVIGILKAVYWRNMDIGQCMMLEVMWRLVFLQLLEMESGIGQLLDQRVLLRFKVGFPRFLFVTMISLFGDLQKELTRVLKHGIFYEIKSLLFPGLM
jgi:hypothetical protein